MSLTISKQHDAEFNFLRGDGTRRHREVCYSNAQSGNRLGATMQEPRCKMCETKLAIELRA
jgi:hypothetical protein